VLLAFPQPYDFALSLERYRTFAPDLAYLWHEGGLHRVVSGREVRITAADGGVRVDPGEPALAEPVRRLLGADLDLDSFRMVARRDRVLAGLVARLPGFRPPLAPDGFEQLVSAITALARADVDLGALAALPDEEVKERLLELPGIGEWTAEWYLARHLGRPDVFPAGDLGLRKAVSAFYAGGRPLSVEETRAIGERFSPHRNLAAHYLLTGARVLEG
jgi:3-methyladenine DNA glycosylase/8-oxoguanine DNA glycosylase